MNEIIFMEIKDGEIQEMDTSKSKAFKEAIADKVMLTEPKGISLESDTFKQLSDPWIQNGAKVTNMFMNTIPQKQYDNVLRSLIDIQTPTLLEKITQLLERMNLSIKKGQMLSVVKYIRKSLTKLIEEQQHDQK